jgi:hypothetical protein
MSVIRREGPALIVFSCLVNPTAAGQRNLHAAGVRPGAVERLDGHAAVADGGGLVALAIYGLLEQARRVVILGRASRWLEGELSGPVIRRALQGRLAGVGPEAGLKDIADLRGFVPPMRGGAKAPAASVPWLTPSCVERSLKPFGSKMASEARWADRLPKIFVAASAISSKERMPPLVIVSKVDVNSAWDVFQSILEGIGQLLLEVRRIWAAQPARLGLAHAPPQLLVV